MEQITNIDRIIVITFPLLQFVIYGIAYIVNYVLEKFKI
jgi:hypothetical protein